MSRQVSLPGEGPQDSYSDDARMNAARTGVQTDIDNGLKREKPISYWTLLADRQIAVLCFLRIAGQLGTLSQLLRYLSPDAAEDKIAIQAGLLVGIKTLAKVCTAVVWGLLADKYGRKMILVSGLVASAVFNAGFGFSTSLPAALTWQALQGTVSNEIFLTRTIAAELYAEASSADRSRALLLPLLVSGLGMIFGPVLGGFTSSRAGLGVLSSHPYALPNLVVATWYAVSAVLVLIYVQETLHMQHGDTSRQASGLQSFRRWLKPLLPASKNPRDHGVYAQVPQEESIPLAAQDDERDTEAAPIPPSNRRMPTIADIWTAKVAAVMIAQFLLVGHVTAFGTAFTVFLANPIDAMAADAGDAQNPPSPLLVAGGLGWTAPQVGTFLTSAAVLFAVLQGLAFPRLIQRFGTIRVWRHALLIFPLIYFFAPLTNLLASKSFQSVSVACVTVIMVLYMTAQALAMPPLVLLISDCVPHPAVRGTVNAVGATVANLARTIFPVVIMLVYGAGLERGLAVGAFWLMSLVAVLAIISSRWVGLNLDETKVLKRSVEATD